jgi:hypothetical protein
MLSRVVLLKGNTMAYSTPTDIGADDYSLVFRHNSTGVEITMQLEPGSAIPAPTRAQKDAVFQALVDRITGMAGVTVLGATRIVKMSSTVTSP